jgi:uncharacterized protein (DUF302 family)
LTDSVDRATAGKSLLLIAFKNHITLETSMKNRCVAVALTGVWVVLLGFAQSAWAQTASADGLLSVRSPHSVTTTMTRLEDAVKERGFAVIAKVDHAAGAARVNKTLRPTMLLIFGNPQGGTPLMECAQTAGIDLPLKALVWEDASGAVMLSYNDPKYLGARHKADACPVLANMAGALDGLVKGVVAAQ